MKNSMKNSIKNRRRSYVGDDESAISSATPVISNSSRRKRRQKTRRAQNDCEDWSNVTPVTSNITPGTSDSKHQSKKGEIDYGQIVVDARTISKNARPSHEKGEKRRQNNDVFREDSIGAQRPIEAKPLLVEANEDNEENENIDESEPITAVPTKNLLGVIGLPFLVAIFSTIRFVLSTTSSLTCSFIEVDIGFSPENVKFASSKIQVGFWAYERGKCLAYPGDFSKVFVNGKSSWRASRTAAIANIILGFLIFIVTAFVISYRVLRLWPSSARMTTCVKGFDTVWELVVFIPVVICFNFEVVKFSFWGANLCTEEIWMTDKYSFVQARDCKLSTGARCSLSAMAFDVIIIIVLTIASRNLRITLAKFCCCRKFLQKDTELVSTTENRELSRPRYFFEGADVESDGASIVSNHRSEKYGYKGNSDEESITPLPNNQKGEKSALDSENKDSHRNNGSGDESVIPISDTSISAKEEERKWVKMANDSDSESIVPIAKARSDSGSDNSSQHKVKNESSRSNQSTSDTADLLGFGEPLVEDSRQPLEQKKHKREDSDDIGFPDSF